MAIATISQIKAAIGTGARANLFRVTFAGGLVAGADSDLSFLTKSAALPGSTVGLIEVPHVAGRKLKIVGDRTFTEWTTTVLNDGDFNVRKTLEDYQSGMVSKSFDGATVGNRSQASVLATATIEQLNSASEVVRTYKLYNCFISELGQIDLSYDSPDQVEEFTCTWVYDYYTVA